MESNRWSFSRTVSSSNIALGDPGFALLGLDEWYDTNRRGQVKGPDGKYEKTSWNYKKPYKKGTNGDWIYSE